MAKKKMTQPVQKDTELELFLERKKQLMAYRRNAHGIDLEELMRQADRDYELKPLNSKKQKRNEGLNLRLSENRVNLRSDDDWQSDNSDAATFSKIQTALALLFDRNPSAILNPAGKRFVANTEIARAIFEDSQHKEKFKNKLKLFVFNLGKYGWAYGRTQIKETKCEYDDLVEVNPITGEKKYEHKVNLKRRVDFRPLNNWAVWVDEKARPYQRDTANDWMWREVYTDDRLEEEFGFLEKSLLDRVKEARRGSASDKVNSEESPEYDADTFDMHKNQNVLYFYENRKKDMFLVICNGVKLFSEKLPVHKDLSLITAFWNLRSDLCINGVGIPEIMRQDKNLLDKIRNMSIDQLVLSIYKMFFYDGTLDSEDAQIKLKPGRGQRVLDPSKLRWLEVPDGGQTAVQREERLRENLDESTGISKTLAGSVVADPNIKALALQQAKEAALSKMKTPLDNILDAIEDEARLRWMLIQELNMFPEEVEKMIDPDKIAAYLEEIEHNKELFFHDTTEQAVYALKYPEISANLKLGSDGTYRPSQEKIFFHITPERIRWSGEIKFTAESLLVTNKELQKQMDLDMANLVIPLFAQPPEIALKPAKQILKIYGKDEEDWLPDMWLHPELAQQAQAGVQPQAQAAPAQAQPPSQIPGLETVVSERETEPGAGTTSIVNKQAAANRLE